MARGGTDVLTPSGEPSAAFEEAARCRAFHIGLVPISVIKRLTPAEWGQIRLMSQSMARRLVEGYDAAVVDKLMKEIKHEH